MTRTSVRTGWNTIIALVASALAMLLLTRASRASEIIWQTGWEVARAEAKATSKPLMVDFYTDSSQKLGTEVYPDAQVVALSRRFVMLKLNAQREGAPQAATYKVRSYPTVFFFNPSGSIIQYVSGYAPAPQFAEVMRRALNNVAPRVPAPVVGGSVAPGNASPSPKGTTPDADVTQFAPSALTPQARQQIAAMRHAAYDKNYSRTYVLEDDGSALVLDETGSYPVKHTATKPKAKKAATKPSKTKPVVTAKKAGTKMVSVPKKAAQTDPSY